MTNDLWNPYVQQAVSEEHERRVRRSQLWQAVLEARQQKVDANRVWGRDGLTVLQVFWRQRRLRRRILRAFACFERHHPRWANALFDRHFLLGRALPILERHVHCHSAKDASELAQAWSEQFRYVNEWTLQYYTRALVPVAAEFLCLLQREFPEQPFSTPASNDGSGAEAWGLFAAAFIDEAM